MRKLPAPTARGHAARARRRAADARQHPAHQGVLDCDRASRLAQTALWFGADDLDGTVQEEKIYHMAGSRTPESMTTKQIQRLIAATGREPLERDTLYNIVALTRVVRLQRRAPLGVRAQPDLRLASISSSVRSEPRAGQRTRVIDS